MCVHFVSVHGEARGWPWGIFYNYFPPYFLFCFYFFTSLCFVFVDVGGYPCIHMELSEDNGFPPSTIKVPGLTWVIKVVPLVF